ncbi:MAG: ubiquitin-protein ligase peroxin 12 [Ramalina farinacea]|uniref:Peroxisome assembly protein 12 n=1 Tax=Ramalina farinacea TaxID=258253 RepID=A0AA43TSN7_9LECA|nr:ubiquitin-protein ligase peroxin 12 [Ramalina farinacea]
MEYMAALQYGIDEQKPSLFELLSENQLAALIPPSLRYLLTLATHRHPRYLLRVLNSFDELYALLMLAVERHYLKTYGGGFTENFYGLKRERVLRIKGGEAPRARLGAPNLMRETLQLKDRDVWNNLAIMVGLPYLKRKLDESYEIHAPQTAILGPSHNRRDQLPHDASLRQRIFYYYKWFLRKVYPSINAAYYFSLLAFNLAYLFDNSKYSSPFLWLIGTRIRRLSEADHRAIALAASAPSIPNPRSGPARPGQGSSIFNPATMASTIYPRLLSSLKILLPTSIFALKFLEWWHASDFARQLSKKAAEGMDLPPPVTAGLPKPTTTTTTTSSRNDPQKSTANGFTNTVSLSSKPHPTSSPPQRHRSPPLLNHHKTQPSTNPTNLHPNPSPHPHGPPPTPTTSSLCPICCHAITTPTSAQTGFVFCYTCIFRWVDGSHERQVAFMEGRSSGLEGVWDDDVGAGGEDGKDEDEGEGDDGKKAGQGEGGVGMVIGKVDRGDARLRVGGCWAGRRG